MDSIQTRPLDSENDLTLTPLTQVHIPTDPNQSKEETNPSLDNLRPYRDIYDHSNPPNPSKNPNPPTHLNFNPNHQRNFLPPSTVKMNDNSIPNDSQQRQGPADRRVNYEDDFGYGGIGSDRNGLDRPDTGFSDYTSSERDPGECTCFVCWLPEPPADADALDADVYDRYAKILFA